VASGEMRDEAALCARNNVEWCDLVCWTHGVAGAVGPDFWIQREKGPPYYSNLVTLSRSGEASQRAAIESLKSDLPGGFSIKDSFAGLDLSAAGFRLLFDAKWLWREPREGSVNPSEWKRIASERDLERWESAWAENGSPTSTRVFLPPVLDEPAMALLGVERDGALIAGCAANRSSGGVVGFSNFFAATEDRDALRADAISEVAAFAPGCAIVGYDRGDDLRAMLSLGFRSVGSLRVWLWP
jgi:hypothetical protein